jgi:putative membrane protein
VTPAAATDDGWLRLDPRVLLTDPVKVLKQVAVPAVIALVGIGSGDRDFPWWAVPLVVVGAVLAGAVPWLTTRYRVTDTQFEQRRGLLNRQHLTAPLDRVRSVDLEASLLHRLLGLTKVQVGTGVDDTRITLDAVSPAAAADLRHQLLGARARVPGVPGPQQEEPSAAPPAGPGPEQVQPGTTQPGTRQPPTYPVSVPPVTTQHETTQHETTLARIDWSWLRFAPFSLSRLVVVAAALGAVGQFADELPVLDAESVGAAWHWVLGFALPLVAVTVVVGALLAWVVVSVTGYVVQWWDLQLTRGDGSVHLRSGLFTTRSVTVEEKRIRGVELSEPLLLRWVGGAELATLATGVQHGVTKVLPPCPLPVARGVGAVLLEDDHPVTAPLAARLVAHGPRARRRCHVRSQWPTLALTAASVAAAATLDWIGWWVPVAVALVTGAVGVGVAEAAYSHLGHALTGRHLVAGKAELTRVRTVLETDGIIGWVVRESWWQRRVGLATLVATTAAGAERVAVTDVPRGTALALAATATPGLLEEFLVRPAGAPL